MPEDKLHELRNMAMLSHPCNPQDTLDLIHVIEVLTLRLNQTIQPHLQEKAS